jgi:hypothetical protein
VDAPDNVAAAGKPIWSKMPPASGLASSAIDAGGGTSSTPGVVVGGLAGGGFRTRSVIVLGPTPCARRIGPGC